MGCILKGGGGLYSRLVVGAVLLAAGEGARFGRRPKSLLQLGGVPLITRQVVALSGAGVDELVVVLGHHADAIEPAVQSFPVTLIRNPRPQDGQVSSLRAGLAALSDKIDVVVVALADQPLIGSADIHAVIGAYKKRNPGTEVVVPRVNGEPGNPVAFSASVRQQILAGDANVGCKQWRAAHPQAVHWFDSDNRRYRTDVDCDDDIARLQAKTGHQLKWPAEWAQAAGSDAPAVAAQLPA
ncbi:nucleotidyltransferase family protein [Ideonella sp. DXS22W]|uniref:Nucleotidyltransferase family protein n=1 Tax=Pseudaquabacterium inlustre TaxID=2984192 RepID=A0ABU9CI95_9BURK